MTERNMTEEKTCQNEDNTIVKKGDLHSIPVAGHEDLLCPHCMNNDIQIRNDHHYLPYFTVLCNSEDCRMETSYETVYLVCETPTPTKETEQHD